MGVRILGVGRSACFSPHSVERDTAIFRAVAERLERCGHYVSAVNEDELAATDLEDADLVFSMARGKSALTMMAEAERTACLKVVNSAAMLLKMTRDEILISFERQGISQPAFEVLDEAAFGNLQSPCRMDFPFWIKRADACAQQVGDVCFLQNGDDWLRVAEDFNGRGIHKAVLAKHLEGDLVKFYGVEGTDFFYLNYATEKGAFSKFGLEAINGAPKHYGFDRTALKRLADKAAVTTGLLVYGGDAVVTEDGNFYIIDFNDWPSYSACCGEAAQAIAERIGQIIK